MNNHPTTDKHPVLLYFAVTLAVSWGTILLIFGTAAIPATEGTQQKVGTAILLGPALAGLLLTAWFKGMKGLGHLAAGLVRWRIQRKWYAAALLIAPLSTLAGIGLFWLFGFTYTPAVFHSGAPWGLVALGIFGGLTIGLFEEIGWTGFATPWLMKKRGVLQSGFLLGLMWGAWHLILFWESDSFSKTMPFLLLMARLFSWLPAYRVLMVWIYRRTQSLLISVLMHASLVASITVFDPNLEGRALLAYIMVRAGLLWLLVIICTKFIRDTSPQS